jgi:hypothetical protein
MPLTLGSSDIRKPHSCNALHSRLLSRQPVHPRKADASPRRPERPLVYHRAGLRGGGATRSRSMAGSLRKTCDRRANGIECSTRHLITVAVDAVSVLRTGI